MKKILMICMVGLLGALSAHAITMCVTADTLPIVLDPSIAGTDHSSNEELSEWRTEFPYGTVFGVSTCVSTYGGAYGASIDTLIDDDTGDIAIGAESLGVYCWCKMTHPVNSLWVYRSAYTTVAGCGSNCAYYCADRVRDVEFFRTSMFGSISD